MIFIRKKIPFDSKMEKRRSKNKAFVHEIEWEKDIVYYMDYIVEAGFTDLEAADSMSMDLVENTSLSYLFTGYIENPDENISVKIFYDILLDILRKRSQKPYGLKRGDMIHIVFLCESEQDGWFFWNGTDIIRGRETKRETFGIPEEFVIFQEFPPNYWVKFPFDTFGGENVLISKELLRTSKTRAYTATQTIFSLEFQSDLYILILNKDFAEMVLDSSEADRHILENIEIPNEAMDFLRLYGMDSETIYDCTVCCSSINEDELAGMMEDLGM